LLITQYNNIRMQSEQLCISLEKEDYGLQAMADTSPVKWHLAHTTWFFETFILKVFEASYECFDKSFEYLFNSYYNAIGKQFPRDKRHLISRPTVDTIYAYRAYVDKVMRQLIQQLEGRKANDELLKLIYLGLNHEQQHQELIVTDLKYNLAINPINPCYQTIDAIPIVEAPSNEWYEFDEQLVEIGVNESISDSNAFCFDNETPRHKALISKFQLSRSLVTNAEFIAFIDADGYQTASHWLSDAWTYICNEKLSAPLYWQKIDGCWFHFSLYGLLPVDPNAPLCHISFYEANAFANWRKCRLPTEFEWEFACQMHNDSKTLLADAKTLFHPIDNDAFIGSVWQWTQSSYQPYPGFEISQGAVGEYNGKFMCNQMVLKGGSCATPTEHSRISYRNFFYPHQRWQFSGLRLAR